MRLTPRRWPMWARLPLEVRKPDELSSLDGLILPGGESTTMLKFLERLGFFDDA